MPALNTVQDILLSSQILTQEEFDHAFIESQKQNTSFTKQVVELGLATQEELEMTLKVSLEAYYGVEYFEFTNFEPDEELISLYTYQIFSQYKFFPISRSGNFFNVAMVDPNNILAEREIKTPLRNFGKIKLKKKVVLEDEFQLYLAKLFNQDSEKTGIIEQEADEIISAMGVDLVENVDEDVDMSDLTDSAQEAPIIQLANRILGVAISRGVSDIHVEPREKEMQVRFRQDGVLNLYKTIPKKIQNALISRYKIMSELDIAERRLPQDGRIRVRMSGKFIDFRVSSLPSKFGEKIVMRILDKSNISLGLDQLITDTNTLEIIRDMIARPYGIIFVTGPTGSGKTTSLYSALSERNSPEVNISTIEDPIEYDLDGITQTEVNKTIGMDFGRALKAFLRQDPDIMLVGETRDKETAKIAVEAALTGHLVFTTLHTNDAPGSIMRLKEMDVEPFLIASSTIGIIAQRLLRKTCPECKQAYAPEESILEYLSIDHLPNKTYYKGEGCDNCNGTGYKGRIGAYEVMRVNDDIRDLIAANANTSELKLAAQENGMKTLFEYSIQLATEGLTTLDEVIRVTFSNESNESICPSCSKPVGEEYNNCPFCQYELKKTCPRCSMLANEDWVSCSRCGFVLDGTKAQAKCSHCGGELTSGMSDCPWCYKPIVQKKTVMSNNI